MRGILGIAILAWGLFTVAAAEDKLVWEDNFDGSSVDRNKWQFEIGTGMWGWGNNELEYYTERPENVRVADGNLIIETRVERFRGSDYTSARLLNVAPLGWRYGRMEVRARLPDGKHLWPAIWMLPRDSVYGTWAASGEIDMAEMRGQEPSTLLTTLHYGGVWPNQAEAGSGEVNVGVDLSKDFHNYTLNWTKDAMELLFDGRSMYRQDLNKNFWSGGGENPYTANRQPFDQTFYFVLNMAVGGNFFPADRFGTLTPDEARSWAKPTMEVDYVRVYQST